MQNARPSHRELQKKINEAKKALQDKLGIFANPGKAVGELNYFNIGHSDEIWNLIRELLEEISPEHYTGYRPPLKSYEKTINGHDLFAFSWKSHKLGSRIYLKFALKNNRYYYVSLHPSKEDN